MTLTTRTSILPLTLVLAACPGPSPAPMSTDGGSTGGGSTDGGSTGTGSTGTGSTGTGTTAEPTTTGETTDPTASTEVTTSTTTGPPPPPSGSLDVLFVVDNSGSMAAAQQRLAAASSALLILGADLDLRIGITTTDNGNPRCPNATYTPEKGAMSTDSCIARVAMGEFDFNGTDVSAACTDVCSQGSWTIKPTGTADDPVEKPRPWFEQAGGQTNVDIPLPEALACSLPQGVAGCGFESQLESMRAALTRAMTADDEQFGFLRPEADLAVVFVTDEMDCSYAPAWTEIFISNKVFWNDPQDPAPSSAMCFRAGAQCIGAPPQYDDCSAVDKDVTGTVTNVPGDAVLRPVAEYVDFLQQIAASKAGASVRLYAVAGVPVGFEDGSAELVFEDSTDPDYQSNFGLGPGCVFNDGQGLYQAFPPLRLLEVAEPLGPPRFYSICADDLSPVMAGIVKP